MVGGGFELRGGFGPGAGFGTERGEASTLGRIVNVVDRSSDVRSERVDLLALARAALGEASGEAQVEQAGLVGQLLERDLLDPIVDEAIHDRGPRAGAGADQDRPWQRRVESQEVPARDRLPDPLAGQSDRLAAGRRERVEIEARADAGGDAQAAAGSFGQRGELLDQKFDQRAAALALGRALDVDPPLPARPIDVEDALGVVGHQQLGDIQGRAAGPTMQEARERLGVGARVEHVLDQRDDVGERERAQLDHLADEATLLESREHPRERMRGVEHGLVAGREHDGQAPLGAEAEALDQAQARRVGPLHVVDEDHEVEARDQQRGGEALERVPEAIAGLGRADLDDVELGAEQQLDLGDEGAEQRAVGSERLADALAQRLEVFARAMAELGEQAAEDLAHARVRRGLGVLIELAADEHARSLGDRVAQLVDQRRLAGARGSADDDQARPIGRGAGVLGQEPRALGLAAVEASRRAQPLGGIERGQLEVRDRAFGIEGRQAAREVGPEPERALVAILGGRAEQLGHDLGDHRRQLGPQLGQRGRSASQQGVDPLGLIVELGEGRGAAEQPVQGRPEPVVVAAVVDRLVDPAGLLGRHVAERALEAALERRPLERARDQGRDPEVDQDHALERGVDEQVAGLDVLVNDALGVDRRERVDDAQREDQALAQARGRGWPLVGDPLVERDQAGVAREDQRGLVGTLDQLEHARDLGRVEHPRDEPFVAIARQGLGRRHVGRRALDHDLEPIADANTSLDERARRFTNQARALIGAFVHEARSMIGGPSEARVEKRG